MDENRRATIIDEWYKALANYPVQICQKAWAKYRDTVKIRELNIQLFVGIIKDLHDADVRKELADEQKRMLPEKTGDEIVYTYRCRKCMDTGIISWQEDGLWFGRKCDCDYFDRYRLGSCV